MYQFLWIFFIYAFLGWCTEVSYAALVSGTFVNRGFLNGPVCPIYGFGVVIVLSCLEPLKENLLLLFLGSVLLTSLLEWVTGFLLERLFHQRWWDYSDQPFNLSGYICLRFSIAWGLACLFVVDILHPTVLWLIHTIPHPIGWVLLWILGVTMFVDLVATLCTIIKLNRRLSQIDDLAGKIKKASNEFGETLAEHVIDAAEKGSDLRDSLDDWMDEVSQARIELGADLEQNVNEWKGEVVQRLTSARQERLQRRTALQEELSEWKDKLDDLFHRDSFGQRRLLKAFPQMRSTHHKQAMERLHRHISSLSSQQRK
ncbi:MAG: putative ABC transporter permease [Lawsonibacter sp.]|jgi:uncharacterized membrane protein